MSLLTVDGKLATVGGKLAVGTITSGGTSSGGTSQPITPAPSTPTKNGNRIEIVLDQAVAAPSASVTGKLYCNGLWTGGTASVGGGAAITLPSSGNDPVPFSLTAPSQPGEASYAVTNTAGLVTPYPAPLTVFAAGSGSAQAIGASLPWDMRTYQRDTASGNPSGFSASWGRGWGEVWITMAQAGPALFVRLHDALSNGAGLGVGTGTAISGIVQVHGAFSAGSVRVLLPAGPYIYWADVATDAAFTSPVRIAQRFRVGVVIGHMSRSQETGLERDYAGAANGTHLPLFYGKTATWAAYDHRYANTDGGWFLQDGGTDPYQYHYSEPTSSGPQEFGRLIEAQFGVCCGITGVSDTGGGFDTFFHHDGSLASGFADTVTASCGEKFRYLWIAMGGWDGVEDAYKSETYAEDATRIQAAIPKLATAYPACAVIGWVHGASGWFGTDGSADIGYTRLQAVVDAMQASNPMVVSKGSTLWNDFYGSHATQIARLDYIRPSFRRFMASELAVMGGLQTADRGPTLAATGTRSGRVISLPYTLHGGTALTSVRAAYNNPTASYGTASAAEIASLFAIYGGTNGRNPASALAISGAAINAAAGTIELTLAADASGPLTVHYGADFGVSNATVRPQYSAGGAGVGVSLCDDRTGLGIPYGWLMRAALDIAVS